jgi:hypothetical protein
MVIELKVIESQRESPAAPWVRRVLDVSRYTVEGTESDWFPVHVTDRAPRGEPLRIISFDAQPIGGQV